MRVLIVSNLYPPAVLGGYEMACAQVAGALRTRGHEVRVLTTWNAGPGGGGDPDWVERRLDLHWYLPHPPQAVLAAARHAAMCSCPGNTFALLDAMRRFVPDVVYVWNVAGIGGLALMDALNLTGQPWALHLMDNVPGELFHHTPGSCLALFGADAGAPYAPARVVAMSEYLLDLIRQDTAIDLRGRATIIPGWVDAPPRRPHAPYLRDGVARFVSAGRLSDHKGVHLILEAAARLHRDGLPFEIDIYGAGDHERYAATIRADGLDDRVRLRGSAPQEALLAAYGDHDAFLFPTHEREAFGFAPIEAASRGTPPVLSALCGVAERLVGGVHCVKIQRNAVALADAMAAIAAGRVDLAAMGRAAANLVATDLAFHRCMDAIEVVLRDTARAGEPARRLHDPRLAALLFHKHNLGVRLWFG